MSASSPTTYSATRVDDEQAFRYNHRRDMNDADRLNMVMTQIVGKRLTYKALIGGGKEAGTPEDIF